ncbi:hypothetical protein G7046_g10156 [Stylonectria norvegica]|nr:hypothetical protein G7046_g10156 [Stylonectria norvegica]
MVNLLDSEAVNKMIIKDIIQESILDSNRRDAAILATTLLIIQQQQELAETTTSYEYDTSEGSYEEESGDGEDEEDATVDTPDPMLTSAATTRKRSYSPSREETPCPGPNREAIMQTRKRLRIDQLPPVPIAREARAEHRQVDRDMTFERVQNKILGINNTVQRTRHMYPNPPPSVSNRADVAKAVDDVRGRFANKATEAQIRIVTNRLRPTAPRSTSSGTG